MTTVLLATISHSITFCEKTRRWVPSRMYQRVIVPDDPAEKIEPTHLHDFSLHWDAPDAYMGGGITVLDALSRMHKHEARFSSADVAVIGGRPRSLNKLPSDIAAGINEASVVSDYLTSIYGVETTHVINTAQTLDDEISALLRLAESYDDVYVIMMDHRLWKYRLALQAALKSRPAHELTSRKILLHGALQYLPDYINEIVTIQGSAAYKRTMEREYHETVNLIARLNK